MAILNTNNKITLAFYMTKAAEYLAKAKKLIEKCKDDPKTLEEIQTAIGYAKYYENQTETIIGTKLIKIDIVDQVPDTDDGEEESETNQFPPRTSRNTMISGKEVCNDCGYNVTTGHYYYKCYGNSNCPAANRRRKIKRKQQTRKSI